MLALADNRSFGGTLASRMAADTRAAEAAPGWTGVGAEYAAWLRGKPHESGLDHHRQSTGTGVPGGHEWWRPFVGHPPPLPVEGTGGGTQSPQRTLGSIRRGSPGRTWSPPPLEICQGRGKAPSTSAPLSRSPGVCHQVLPGRRPGRRVPRPADRSPGSARGDGPDVSTPDPHPSGMGTAGCSS
jgi:hypothetical protein